MLLYIVVLLAVLAARRLCLDSRLVQVKDDGFCWTQPREGHQCIERTAGTYVHDDDATASKHMLRRKECQETRNSVSDSDMSLHAVWSFLSLGGRARYTACHNHFTIFDILLSKVHKTCSELTNAKNDTFSVAMSGFPDMSRAADSS